jgi:hypothetical protein|nr:hypothetical protein [Acutalibacter muris]
MEDDPARENRKAWSKSKQEKGGGVAMHLSADSQRPAEPGGMARNYGLF